MADKNEQIINEDMQNEQKIQLKALDVAGLFGVAASKERILAGPAGGYPSYATKRLYNSINREASGNNGLTLELFSSVDYSKTVHTGIIVKDAVFADLFEWLKRKVRYGIFSDLGLETDKKIANRAKHLVSRFKQGSEIKNVNPFFEDGMEKVFEKLPEELKKDGL